MAALRPPRHLGCRCATPAGLSLRNGQLRTTQPNFFFEQSENPRPVLICSESKNEKRKIVPLC